MVLRTCHVNTVKSDKLCAILAQMLRDLNSFVAYLAAISASIVKETVQVEK